MFRVDKLQTQLKTGDNIRMKSFDREYIGSEPEISLGCKYSNGKGS
jgi:hypothetical protein